MVKQFLPTQCYGSLYFWYTQDISYQWISRSPEPLVIKNYTPTADFSGKERDLLMIVGA